MLPHVPLVDLIDESFIVASPAAVAERLRNPRVWREWWPDLSLTVVMDRGLQGIRWSMTGALVGSCEVWIEVWKDGVIVHYFVRADPTRPGSDTESISGSPSRLARLADRERRRRALAWKRRIFALKDELESRSGRILPSQPL
jgi:hypothetical protein